MIETDPKPEGHGKSEGHRKPQGLWFGTDRARCFGMLHRPDAPSSRGVIFCNTLGFEGLLAHRALRHIADDLTDRGFWALGFDYDGEGDSAGGAWEPRRVEAWVSSLDAAVALMRSRGVSDIRLVGFRVGASLAYLYATNHPGISGVVLWAPCVRGSAYVREQRALSRLSAVARPPQRVTADRFPDDSMEIAGFELSAPTLKDLAAIDLLTAPAPIVPPAVLVIDRDDAPANDDLVAKLVESGARVDHELMTRYEEFITDGEENAELPRPTMERIGIWLGTAVPEIAATTASGEGVAVAVESAKLSVDDPNAGRFTPPDPPRDGVVEEPVWIDGRFFAIISRPAGRAPIRRASILLCNTGSNNRIGPGRLYVDLARYWAGLGFTVVRVDLGGAGDSLDVDPPTENNPLAPIRIEELRDVVTWIRRATGFDHIAVSGMCSGAFNALHVVIDGIHIDHLLLVNPGVFYLADGETVLTSDEGALHSAYALTRGVTSARKWKGALRDPEVLRRGVRSVRYLFRTSAVSGLRFMVAASARNAARSVGLPVKAPSAIARDLEQIVARGVNVLFVFAAEESAGRYLRTFGGAALDALAKRDGYEVIEIDGGDHQFSPPGSRQKLVEALTRYLEREYAPTSSTAERMTPRKTSDVQG